MEVSFDLTIAWALLLAFATFVYVVLDGFDLGIGILYPFFPEKSDRDLMMNSVAPVWDGNETWLILGGGGLFAAFPLAYAIILPAVYVPIIVMQGDEDRLVTTTREWVAKMKELGMEHLYVEVKGGDHSRFINANADTLEKIFAFFNIVRKDQRPETN